MSDTFGSAVKQGATYGALGGIMLSADGNPLIGGAVGAGVGAVIGGARNVVKAVKSNNAAVRRNKRIEEVRQHMALRKEQFRK